MRSDYVRISLPRLVGTRSAAGRILHSASVSENLAGLTVLIDGGIVVASTISFADELLRELNRRRAESIVVLSAPPELARDIADVSDRRGFLNVTINPDQTSFLF